MKVFEVIREGNYRIVCVGESPFRAGRLMKQPFSNFHLVTEKHEKDALGVLSWHPVTDMDVGYPVNLFKAVCQTNRITQIEGYQQMLDIIIESLKDGLSGSESK